MSLYCVDKCVLFLCELFLVLVQWRVIDDKIAKQSPVSHIDTNAKGQ